MPENNVTISGCQGFRKDIYAAIFPRWILLVILLGIVGSLSSLYLMNGKRTVEAADAMKKAENNDTRFTLEIEHTNDGLSRLESQFTEQHALLIKIDKKIPDTGRGD